MSNTGTGDADDELTTDGTLEGNVSGILTQLKALPQTLANLILDGIKSIFLPDPDSFQSEYMLFLDELNNKYLFDFDLDALFSLESAPEDITATYSVGEHSWNTTFVSWLYLKRAVIHFRPFIRGFIVLMLIFYNLKQFMSLFGLGGLLNGTTGEALKAWYGVGDYSAD